MTSEPGAGSIPDYVESSVAIGNLDIKSLGHLDSIRLHEKFTCTLIVTASS